MEKEWQELKKKGSKHYKTGATNIQPIDLYRAGSMFRDFAISSIIKYAYRNRAELKESLDREDMRKIKHYCDLLLAVEK